MKIATTRSDIDRRNIKHKLLGTLARVAQAGDKENPKVVLGGKPPVTTILPDICKLKTSIIAELRIVGLRLGNNMSAAISKSKYQKTMI